MTAALPGDLDGLPVAGVTLGHPDTATAEHWLASLDPPPLFAATHLVRDPRPHVAWTLVFAGSVPPVGDPCPAAAAAHGSSGRAVVYPGSARLVGDLTVAQILAASAIDRITILGGGTPAPSAVVRTGDYVRPQFHAGELVLTVMPAAGGTLVPFETRNPTPCCADHAF